MSSKISVDKQHLHLDREDLALKRKMMETSDNVDQQFISNTSKMTKDDGKCGKCNHLLLRLDEENV